MAGYADLAQVYAQLRVSPDGVDAAARRDRLDQLNTELSRALDQRIGRSFGAAAEPQTRWITGRGSDLLVLDAPILSVTAIAMGSVVSVPTHYRLRYGSVTDGFHAIQLLTGAVWYGDVAVTGIWADM